MQIEDFIKKGEAKAGSRPALAEVLDLRPNQVTDAKRRGLPVAACFALAKLIGEDPAAVIAASELVTEKKPERRAVLLPFVRHAAALALVTGVNLLLTPAPVEAAQALKNAPSQFVLC